MTIKKKRIVVSAFVTLSAMAAITATAAAASLNTTPFEFNVGSQEQQYTDPVLKTDRLQTAYVKVDGGDFIAGEDKLYTRVCKNIKGSDGVYLFATETKWVDGPYEFLLNYQTGTPGVQGNYYRLRGYQASTIYPLYAYGEWEP